MDKEVRPLVRAMNLPGLGMRTIDSCAGHPRRALNTVETYVGFEITDRRACTRFWRTLWLFLGRCSGGSKGYNKVQLPGGKDTVWFVVSLFGPPGLSPFRGFYRLRIAPRHNPTRARGRYETLYGLDFLTAFIREYVGSLDHSA